jgi:hypothetical protein
VFAFEAGGGCGLAVATAVGLAGCGGKLVCVLGRFPDRIAPSPVADTAQFSHSPVIGLQCAWHRDVHYFTVPSLATHTFYKVLHTALRLNH